MPDGDENSSGAAAPPFNPSAETLLGLVRAEATKFGRCCDLYQDGLGTFADHECQQRTFAMLRGVQRVLGVDKAGGPLDADETLAARSRAALNNAAPDLLAALEDALPLLSIHRSRQSCDAVRAIIAKAKGETP